MRSIARMGLIAAVATLAGCQTLQYGPDRFSTTVYDEVPAHPIRFPVKLTYPDNTMFGFAIYDDDPRSDLRLESISCRRGGGGVRKAATRSASSGDSDTAASAASTDQMLKRTCGAVSSSPK